MKKIMLIIAMITLTGCATSHKPPKLSQPVGAMTNVNPQNTSYADLTSNEYEW